jgi:EmrB/QacA subfamily drug resistance transporter
MVIGPASGPVLGGYLVEFHDWRWIFLINIPIGAMAFVFAGLFLKEEKQDNPGRLDLPGLGLAAVGLGTLMYALAQAGEHGLDDPSVLAFGGTGIAVLLAFAIVELRVPEPMIDMRLFTNKLFAAANAVQVIAFAGLMGGLFLLPLFLQSPATRGLGAFESGLATFPQAIGVVVMMQVTSRLYPIIGPRRLMATGLLWVTVFTGMFALVDVGTSLWWVRGIMFARGMGFAFIIVCLQTATYATIPPVKMGRASAVSNAGRQVGASFGVALLATILTSRLISHDTGLQPGAETAAAVSAFHESFLIASAITLVGAIASLLLISDKEAAPSMRTIEVPLQPDSDEGAAVPVSAGH